MLFSSMTFLWIFLPVVIISTLCIPNIKYQNTVLLFSSLLFYAWGEPVYVFLMLLSIALNWGFGLLIDKMDKYRKIWLVLCVLTNLSLLGYFKYYDFFASAINSVASSELVSIRNIALPIGISFFTFQALSYVIDVYRGDCKVQKNILNLALYVSFFPQLIAGPIVRYHDIDEQIQNRQLSMEKFAFGLRRFIYGLGKKVIISNTCAEIVDYLYALDVDSMAVATAWIAAILYTLQIYYDFSGYSDMAIGLGRIFGFEFLENFRYPYMSRSIHEFWQRWHISLGTWFKEYVYIPLGGNRKGNGRTYINLCIVFFLTGMWHGASWNFIFWGLYHGIFQIVERLGFHKILKKFPLFSHLYCMLIVVIGWVFFRIESLEEGFKLVAKMMLPWKNEFLNLKELLPYFSSRKIIIVLLGIIGAGVIQWIGAKYPKLKEKWMYSICEMVYCMVVLFYSIMQLAAGTYNPFIYFRF